MKNQKGFTLIELLVVISIIGLLSTLAVVSLNNARVKSRDAKRVADVKSIQNALELFFNDCNGYPSQAAYGLLTPSLGDSANCSGKTFGDYMAQVPSFPLPLDGATAGTNDFRYQSTLTDATSSAACTAAVGTTCGGYRFIYWLKDKTGDLSSGQRTASPRGL